MRGGWLAAGCALAAMWAAMWAIGAEAASFGGNCVYYARQVSGISLDGNAGSWWSNAQGRYDRGKNPSAGAVLVFKPTGHMRVGHVAVVSRVVSPREILVDQANWVRGRVVQNMSVIDASPQNDWTIVKVLELHSRTHGRPNPTYGFIYPRAPHPHNGDVLLASNGSAAERRGLPVRTAVAIGDEGPTKKSTRPAVASKPARGRTDDRNAKRDDKHASARSDRARRVVAADRTLHTKRGTPRIESAERRG